VIYKSMKGILSKRIISLLLALVMILVFASACNNRSLEIDGNEIVRIGSNKEAQEETEKDLKDDVKENQEDHKKSQSSNLKVDFLVGNSWENNGVTYTQADITVHNNGDFEISNWEVEIAASEGSQIDQIWNATYRIDNNKIIFIGEEFNQIIPAKGSVAFGCILVGVNNIDSNSIKVSYIENNTMIAENVAENNQVNNNQGSREYVQPEKLMPKDVPAPTTDDWLYVKGNKIVDKYGQEVWITGVNWFGYNTGTNTFDGLWAADLNTSLAAIADRGFNLLRIPISSELILQWASGNPPKANFNEAINSYLVGMDSLQIFDYVVGQSRANGLKIMIDIHSAKTDPMGHMKPVWFEADITEQDYLDSLSWVAERYKDDDTIIAYDLKNEPHGKPNESPRAIWNDSKDPENWKYVAEKAANAVLSKNPNVLVLVEGIEIYPKNIKTNGDYSSTNSADYYINWWGGNLRGVKDYPINLGKYQNKLVYSPHDYGPAVYAQPWFEGAFTYESLYKDCWRDNWMFIYEDEIAPLLIGEWGGFMSEPNLTWMKYLRELIKKHKLHHTFWCFNANSGDTGGLVLDDFVTWDEEKYNFVKEVLWTKEGKFVGLDHEIPLGKNGIALPKK